MKIEELDINISNIHIFLLEFKKKICSEISIIDGGHPILLWKLIFNNRNTFNTDRCYAKTESGHQCKRSKGYCGSIFCGLHYSGKGAHIRKRNETVSRFYEKDNQTIMDYTLEFFIGERNPFNLNNLQSIYIDNEKYYIDSCNGDVYIMDDSHDKYRKRGNINSNNLY